VTQVNSVGSRCRLDEPPIQPPVQPDCFDTRGCEVAIGAHQQPRARRLDKTLSDRDDTFPGAPRLDGRVRLVADKQRQPRQIERVVQPSDIGHSLACAEFADAAAVLGEGAVTVAGRQLTKHRCRGGVSAKILDHVLGDAASTPGRHRLTGTITVRYWRLTPLGRVHAEARVTHTEGFKTYVVGHLGDDTGVTVEAEGVFIEPRWARD